MTAPPEEQVLIVDAHNRPAGTAARSRMRAEGLAHRATCIFVFDRAGRLLVQKRTATKDLYPGYYDAAAGGVMVAGETWEESAAREAEEELGITVPLSPRFDFYFEDGTTRYFGRAFTCVHDGPFRLQAEEVERVEFVDPQAVLDGALAPLTPDTLHALEILLAESAAPGHDTGAA